MSSREANDTIVSEIAIEATMGRVYEAITDPIQRVNWWGAEGKFQATHMESDLRPGGAWLMRGVGMKGEPFTLHGTYRVVQPPHLLEFTWNTDREDEPETLVRIALEESEGTTTVRLIHSGFSGDAIRQRYQGWPWLLALLRAHVARQ